MSVMTTEDRYAYLPELTISPARNLARGNPNVTQLSRRLLGIPSANVDTIGTGTVVAVVADRIDWRHPGAPRSAGAPNDMIGFQSHPIEQCWVSHLMAGIIAGDTVSCTQIGIAPGSLVEPYLVSSCGESASQGVLANAVHRAVQGGANVVALPWLCEGRSLSLETAITHANKAGAVVVMPSPWIDLDDKDVDDTWEYPGAITVNGIWLWDERIVRLYGNTVPTFAVPAYRWVTTGRGSSYVEISGQIAAVAVLSGLAVLAQSLCPADLNGSDRSDWVVRFLSTGTERVSHNHRVALMGRGMPVLSRAIAAMEHGPELTDSPGMYPAVMTEDQIPDLWPNPIPGLE